MHRRHYHKQNRIKFGKQDGYLTAELAAAICLFLPIVATICWVIFEASRACEILCVLNQTSATAARRLAIAYGQNPSGTIANPSTVFNQVTFGNIVNSSSQFSIPNGGWQTTSNPPTVTVVCTYQSGQHGCPQFPAPDPLNLSSTFTLTGQATCKLE
jgi:hypothetical protein